MPVPGGAPPPPPPPGAPGGGAIPDSGRVRDDWSFSVVSVFGAARVRAIVPEGWTVKAILHDGRDIADTPIEMKSGETMSGVQVIVSNRVTTISGQLLDDKGAPLVDGTVIVFADDASKWSDDSRWVRAVRPDQQGRYQIKDCRRATISRSRWITSKTERGTIRNIWNRSAGTASG